MNTPVIPPPPPLPQRQAELVARFMADTEGVFSEMVRVYGRERGNDEFKALHQGKTLDEILSEGTPHINKLKTVAATNGWDWDIVLEDVRARFNYHTSWRPMNTVKLEQAALEKAKTDHPPATTEGTIPTPANRLTAEQIAESCVFETAAGAVILTRQDILERAQTHLGTETITNALANPMPGSNIESELAAVVAQANGWTFAGAIGAARITPTADARSQAILDEYRKPGVLQLMKDLDRIRKP